MKNIRKILALVLMLASLAAILAVPAFAVSAPKKQVIYLYDKGGNEGYINISGLKPSEVIKKGSLKSSNKKIVAPNSYYYSTSVEQNAKGKTTSEGKTINVNLIAKKTGTAKISYTIGSKTYSTSITVKKYANPLKKLTVTGLNSGKNVASSFKKLPYASKTLTANGKKGSISIEAASGWKVYNIYFDDFKSERSAYYNFGSKGVAKCTVPMPVALKKGNMSSLGITMYNPKDNQFINLSYSIS